MSALGWKSVLQTSGLLPGRGDDPRTTAGKKALPNLEHLENLLLLSVDLPLINGGAMPQQTFDPNLTNGAGNGAGILLDPQAEVARFIAANRVLATQSQGASGSVGSALQPVTLPAQTLTLPARLTNFSNQPLNPALRLFDPSLGTLTSVTIVRSVSFHSVTTEQNLSVNSPATFNVVASGSYALNGLGRPLTGAVSTTRGPFTEGVFNPSNPNQNRIPPIVIDQTDAPPPTVLTSAADLAFFTASAGRTTLSPSATASARSEAILTSTNGNGESSYLNSASATVRVIYTYIPTAPCPTPGTIVRFGVHHQPTLLVLSFNGVVDPTLASDPNNYRIVSPRGKVIRIVSARFDPVTNSVALTPERRLNIHHPFDLAFRLPCPNGSSEVVIPFGGKQHLGGVLNHRGDFVPVGNRHVVRR